MIGMNINQAKSMFFDRPKVMRMIDRTTAKTFSRFGSYTRTVARNSMKKGGPGKVSAPGNPPLYHTRLLKDGIYYAFDPAARSVVIGPVRLNTPSPTGTSQTVPELLEHGGAVRRDGRLRMYRPRPYMGPARVAAEKKLPEFWRRAAA
ncbi:MAG: hypothetical protein WD118_01470 [Phycisphaeraceae bacterium]